MKDLVKAAYRPKTVREAIQMVDEISESGSPYDREHAKVRVRIKRKIRSMPVFCFSEIDIDLIDQAILRMLRLKKYGGNPSIQKLSNKLKREKKRRSSFEYFKK